MALMDTLGSAVRSASRFIVQNPGKVLTLARHAAGLRVAIPLDALRWAIGEFVNSPKAPSDIVVSARPPAVHLGSTVDLMGNKLRASSAIEVLTLVIGGADMKLTIRLSDVQARVLGDQNVPIAKLLGGLDMSNLENLLRFVPKKPPMLVGVKGNVLELDLMKVPKIADNAQLLKALRAVTPVLTVAHIDTEDDLLVLHMRATPSGVGQSLAAVRS